VPSVNMKNVKWDPNNPFMPLLKTADDAKSFIAAGGVACIESKIENVFGLRFDALKEKVRRLRADGDSDVFVANLLVDSILVDCRALFLENEKRARNATLQNVYMARRMDEAATSVNELLNMNVSPGRTSRDVIKAWVDKRVVHVDWLWDEEEERILEDMKAFLFNTEGGGLLERLDRLIEDYEKMRSTFGKNAREKIEMVFSALTG
jgi:hypothetical protein